MKFKEFTNDENVNTAVNSLKSHTAKYLKASL